MKAPEHWVYRGRVMAQALHVSAGLLGERLARRRVLELLDEHSAVEATADGYLVRLRGLARCLPSRRRGRRGSPRDRAC